MRILDPLNGDQAPHCWLSNLRNPKLAPYYFVSSGCSVSQARKSCHGWESSSRSHQHRPDSIWSLVSIFDSIFELYVYFMSVCLSLTVIAVSCFAVLPNTVFSWNSIVERTRTVLSPFIFYYYYIFSVFISFFIFAFILFAFLFLVGITRYSVLRSIKKTPYESSFWLINIFTVEEIGLLLA